MLGTVQNQDAYAQGVAAQRPFYFDHIADDHRPGVRGVRRAHRPSVRAGVGLPDRRRRVRAGRARARSCRTWRSWPITCGEQGLEGRRAEPDACSVRSRPISSPRMLSGEKAVTVFERVDQPLAVDPPLLREIRAAMTQGMENWRAVHANGAGKKKGATRSPRPVPELAHVDPSAMPDFYSAGFGFGSRDLQPGDIVAAVEEHAPRREGTSASSTSASTSSGRARGCPSCRSGRSSSWTRIPTWASCLWSRQATSTCCPRARRRCASTRWVGGAPSPWARTWP